MVYNGRLKGKFLINPIYGPIPLKHYVTRQPGFIGKTVYKKKPVYKDHPRETRKVIFKGRRNNSDYDYLLTFFLPTQ